MKFHLCFCFFLKIEVAQLAAGGGHDLVDGGGFTSVAHIEDIRQLSKRRRRLVSPGSVRVRAAAEGGVAVAEGTAECLPVG